ncbi:MAG: hypothetical protein INF90_01065 [Roseomonas sp.]|jgi:hypothetical protein|nr:hypothetical protein [Roseomonas sp.]
MTEAAIPPKSTRSFSRALVVGNCIAAWCAVFLCIWASEVSAGIVVPAALTLVAWLVGSYMGIGALDFRTATASVQRGGGPEK